MHDESLTDTGSDWFHTFLALLPVRWSSPPTFSDTFVNVLAQNAINKHAACLMYLLLESQIFVLLSWTYPGLGIRLHLYPNYVGNLWQTDLLIITGFFEMKMKYDESDNAFIRASRAVTDKMTDIIGEQLWELSVLWNTEMLHVSLFMLERLNLYLWTLILCLVKMFLVTYALLIHQ